MHELAARVAEAFATLPARYLGADPGFDATYHIRLGDIGRCWEVRCTPLGARLRAGGDLDLAVGFEGLFRLPSGRPPLLRIHDVPVGRLKLSTLTMGKGPD